MRYLKTYESVVGNGVEYEFPGVPEIASHVFSYIEDDGFEVKVNLGSPFNTDLCIDGFNYVNPLNIKISKLRTVEEVPSYISKYLSFKFDEIIEYVLEFISQISDVCDIHLFYKAFSTDNTKEDIEKAKESGLTIRSCSDINELSKYEDLLIDYFIIQFINK